jgi:threonine aldolase
MIRFESDYSEGAHPKILEQLAETNLVQTPGYGEDEFCTAAREIIKSLCGTSEAAVHFLVGGTQTNLTVISAMLRPHQGVVCASTGHINVHEAGAVEATGHKVLSIYSPDGKLHTAALKELAEAHYQDSTHEHMVQPGMAYISHPSENGTLYTKAELLQLSVYCREKAMVLYLDGARLGYGLAAEDNDLTLKDIAALCDVFYIGGTKAGALFGEALVISNTSLQKDFRYFIKQRGGMLAKGRLLGIQFKALMEDGLYFSLAKRADSLAIKIRNAFEAKGFDFLCHSCTNQQFPILDEHTIKKLGQKYAFSVWEKAQNGKTAVRFCTSWATREEDVDMLVEDIMSL